jgi:DNA-binding NtrC family response regulator
MTTTPNTSVLLVDDEPQYLQGAAFALRSAGIGPVITCQDSREAMAIIEKERPRAAVLDMMMPHLTGRELLAQIAERFPGMPAIMLTAVNDVDTAVDCMKAGAVDYLIKPIDKTRLVTTVRKALELSELTAENRALSSSLLSGKVQHPEWFDDIVTRHPVMLGAFQYIEAIGRTSLPVLITAETGCGKELAARSVHAASGRKGEFIAVNAAGLDDTLFSDTLFGHEKGAFTGADAKRPGLIAKAKSGTLFLDEIGDLRLESQVKLLRLLDEKVYYPVGSDIAITTDSRIIVATNRDLGAECEAGRFRKDLFYRLQSHQVVLPPLRDRREDIPLLADFFLEKAAEEIGIEPPTSPPELYVLLGTYHFPGNVRELRGMMFDAVSRHQGGVLSLDAFKAHIDRTTRPVGAPGSAGIKDSPAGGVIFTHQLPTLREIEQMLVDEALRRSQDNQSVASRMLGITRSALNKRINHPREE